MRCCVKRVRVDISTRLLRRVVVRPITGNAVLLFNVQKRIAGGLNDVVSARPMHGQTNALPLYWFFVQLQTRPFSSKAASP